MTTSVNLGLPFIEAAQAQKHVTHNEALAALDACVQLAVFARDVQEPPVDPPDGARYIVGAAASGIFAGRADRIAYWDAAGWLFLTPRAGWIAWSVADAAAYVFDGASWTPLPVRGDVQNVGRLGVGTIADAANPIAAKVNAALFAARETGEGGNGDLRFTLNRQGGANTASQLYQSGWSGRAETGLMGDDKFRVKVSPDGAQWLDAIEIDPATGATAMRSGGSDAPGQTFIGDTDTGVSNPAPDVLGLVTNGGERVRVTPDGCVGIGTSEPADKFDVVADRWFVGGSRRDGSSKFWRPALFNFWLGDGSFAPFFATAESSANTVNIGGGTSLANAATEIRMRTASNTTTPGGSLRLCVRSNGNVGIGTGAPSTLLHAAGPIRCGAYTRTTLPSASDAGAGSTVWVSNPATGVARAFWSNGVDWRDHADVAP